MRYAHHEKEWLERVHQHTNGRCFIVRDLPEHLRKHGNTLKRLSDKGNKLHRVGYHEIMRERSRPFDVIVWRVVL